MSTADRIDEVLADWKERQSSGEFVDPEEWMRAHPELADEMRRRLVGEQSAPPHDTPSSAAALLKRLTQGERAAYTCEGEIARGGMGAILKIRDEALRRDLAMKVILEERVSGNPDLSSAFAHRFLEEAQVTAQLDHPGVVPVHELGVDDEGRLFFTMKLVKGRTLGEILKLVKKGEEDWNRPRAIQLFIRICETLAYAHSKGVVHRDLKPANIMVGDFGEVYVMDWGLAKVLGEHAEPVESEDVPRSLVLSERTIEASSPDSPHQTQAGDVLGTPAYISLEQAMGRSLDARSDIYAVGAMLYELLAGHAPYRDPDKKRSPQDVLVAVTAGPATPVLERTPGLPGEIVAIANKAMARDPAERYQSAAELGQDLRHFVEGRVVQAYRTGPVVELRKWVARNKGLAAALVAAVVFAIGGLGINLYVQKRAGAKLMVARDDAQRNEADARRSEATAQREKEEAQRQRGEAQRQKEEAQLQKDKAQRQEEEAHRQKESAQRQKDEAQRQSKEAQRQSYFANLALAATHLDTGNTAEALRSLEACPEPLRAWEWHHQYARCDTSLEQLEPAQHKGRRKRYNGAISFSLNSERFAVGGTTVRVYDTKTRRLVQRRRGVVSGRYMTYVYELVMNRDGSRVHAVVGDRLVTIDAESGQVTRTIRPKNHKPSGKVPKSWQGAPLVPRFRKLVASHDRTVLASVSMFENRKTRGSIPGWIFIWRAEDGKLLAKLPPDGVSRFALSPDGTMLATSPGNRRLQIRHIATGEILRTIPAPGGSIREFMFTPDGTRLVCLAEENTKALKLLTVTVLSVEMGDEVATWRTDSSPSWGHGTAALTPDSRRLIAGSGNDVHAWDLQTGERISTLRGHITVVQAVAVSPDGRTIVSADAIVRRSPGSGVRVWDASSGEPSIPVRDGISAVSLEASGKRIAVLGKNGIEILDAKTGELLKRWSAVGKELALSPDATRIATGSWDGRVQIWDVASAKRLHDLKVPDPKDKRWRNERTWVSFSADGRVVASTSNLHRPGAGEAGGLHLWSTETGKLLGSLERVGGGSPPVFTRDGKRIVVRKGVVDVETMELIAGFPEPHNYPRAFAFSPNEALIATSHSDGALRLWDPESMEELGVLTGHRPGILSIAFSPDGQRIVSGDQQGVIRIWDTNSQKLVSDLRGPALRRGGHTWINSLAFSPDGKRLCSLNGSVLRCWEGDRAAARELWRHANLLKAIKEVLDPLFTWRVLKEDVIAALREDASLDENLRAAAIEAAQHRPEQSMSHISRRAWYFASRATRSAEHYDYALRWASVAAEREPTPAHRGTRGALEYRNGLYRVSVASLEAADKLNAASKEPRNRAYDLLFLAMAKFQLKEHGDARRILKECDALMQGEKDKRLQGVHAEAKALIAKR